MSEPLQGREVIFEFLVQGQYVKITAMDVESLTEVVIQGPRRSSEAQLKNNALKRLEFVLRKKGIIG